MRRILEVAWDIKPAFIGTASTGLSAGLKEVNSAVGILVGLATLVYLVLRIRRELRR